MTRRLCRRFISEAITKPLWWPYICSVRYPFKWPSIFFSPTLFEMMRCGGFAAAPLPKQLDTPLKGPLYLFSPPPLFRNAATSFPILLYSLCQGPYVFPPPSPFSRNQAAVLPPPHFGCYYTALQRALFLLPLSFVWKWCSAFAAASFLMLLYSPLNWRALHMFSIALLKRTKTYTT